jgi:3-mercaptopyruvate sulfurtransferase SseA
MTNFDNIDTARSYTTEDRLVKALSKFGLTEKSHIVVCNRQGRFTAIFYRVANEFGGNVMFAARHGFKSIG